MSEECEDDYDRGYECGFDDGYSAGEQATIKHYKDKIEDIERDHEKELVKSHREGYDEAEDKYLREIDNITDNVSTLLDNLNSIIKDLRKQNYDLRKENAAITRSIQKST